MPIKITLGQLIDARPVLDKLLKMTFSISVSYQLSRRMRVIKPELDAYDQKQNDLVKELGNPVPNEPDKVGISTTILDPETKVIKINPSWSEFLKKRTELLSVEVNLEVDPIQLKDLTPLPYSKDCPKCGAKVGDVPETGPTGQDLYLLGPLLADPQ